MSTYKVYFKNGTTEECNNIFEISGSEYRLTTDNSDYDVLIDEVEKIDLIRESDDKIGCIIDNMALGLEPHKTNHILKSISWLGKMQCDNGLEALERLKKGKASNSDITLIKRKLKAYEILKFHIVEIDNEPDNGDDYYFIAFEKTKEVRELLEGIKNNGL